MFLKNYTSNVPVIQTLLRIEQALIRCGVSGITKEYANTEGKIAAVTFHIQMPSGKDMVIRLPANEEQALNAFWHDYVGEDKLTSDGQRVMSSYKKKRREDFRQQAERTAWKLVQDWVEVQMSLIQMQQVEWMQVFLPYVWDGSQTFYDRLKGEGFKQLPDPDRPR